MSSIPEFLLAALPFLITASCVALMLYGAHWALLARHPDMGNAAKFPRQLVMLGLTVVGLVAIAIALPVSDSTRNQVIGLVGILVSGMIAFSSTSVIANLMAGIVLRMTRSFHTGDFVRVGEHFGRVAERGLFDVEIQTAQRELVSLSNSYLMANPISAVRSSGAIVSATLSLGYDVHHAKVEPLLVQAALDAGLEDPFTQVLELGNFAITYRVNGLLREVGNLLSARSDLNRKVLDVLHGAGIEIMSPSFMNQRRVAEDASIRPKVVVIATSEPGIKAEEIVFDKAAEAEQLAKERHELKQQAADLDAQLTAAKGDARAPLAASLEQVQARLAKLSAEPEPAQTPDARPAAATIIAHGNQMA